MSRFHRPFILAALALACAATFWPVTEADFLYFDDNHNIYENSRVQELNAANVKWMFTGVGPDIRYKPLTWLTWNLIDAGFGPDPHAYHALNLALHAVNSCLLCLLLIRIGRIVRPPEGAAEEQRLSFIAAGAALLWAVHPLRVEPVAWISCTAHGLCFCFCLLATLRYLKTDFSTPVWRQSAYWHALLLFFGALLTFPLPLGYGAVFLALNVFPLRRLPLAGIRDLTGSQARRVAGELLPFLGLSLLMAAVALYCRWSVQGTFGNPVTWADYPLIDRCMQAAYVWMFYVWKTIFPLNLSAMYLDLTELSGFDWPFLASALALAGAGILLIRRRTEWPGALAVFIAHVGILVPVLGLTERPHFPGDRYSLIDGAILTAGFFGWVWVYARRVQLSVVTGIAGILAVLLAGASFRQTLIWLDDRTFFTHLTEHLADGGQRGMAFVRLAGTYQREGDLALAARLYAAAYRTHPGYPTIDLFLPYGMVLEGLGEDRAAARQYQAAIRLEPGHPEAWKRLGLILLRAGEPDLAAGLLNAAEKTHSQDPDLLLTFAEGFLAAGHSALASELTERAAVLDRRNPRVAALRKLLP